MGGLGTAICKALAKEGFTVVASDLPGLPKKDAWLLATKDEGFAFHVAECDVSDFASCQRMALEVEQTIGPIDVLVNNAGITRDAPLRKMDKSMWDAVMATNENSLFNMTKPVIEGMMSRGWGRIINISSVNGVKGQRGQVNYSTAKAGVLGFTKALAQEVASKGVTVNAIAPGYIATDMVMAIKQEIRDGIVAGIPVGRLGKPEEIGEAVVFIVSAAFMTGATLNINGGMHMC
jgi:acetoacetyl-CoA reductase